MKAERPTLNSTNGFVVWEKMAFNNVLSAASSTFKGIRTLGTEVKILVIPTELKTKLAIRCAKPNLFECVLDKRAENMLIMRIKSARTYVPIPMNNGIVPQRFAWISSATNTRERFGCISEPLVVRIFWNKLTSISFRDTGVPIVKWE
jgi:hypothetical protein